MALALEQKLAKAKRTRRVASELTQILRTLAAAPTSTSAMHPPKSGDEMFDAEIAPSPVHVEPERLTIARGYVGSI